MVKKISCFFIIGICIITKANSQYISKALQFNNPVTVQDSNKLIFSYSNLFYFKDYEYMHNIQTGYTLFGNWHYPRIAIAPNSWLKIEGGVLLQKDFGDTGFSKALPVFSMQIRKNDFRFIFGALEGNLSHGMIEPLLDYESIIVRPIEEGFQFKMNKKHLMFDFWLDWQWRQRGPTNHSEQLNGGLSSVITLTQPDRPLQVKIPFQFVSPHYGGQLDTNYSLTSTVFNHAEGLALEWTNPNHKHWLSQFSADGYYTGYKHFQETVVYPFEKGHGLLFNLRLKSKWDISFLASYWNGNKYIAPSGGKIYQSISSIYGMQNYTEPKRSLLLLNLFYEKELFDDFYVDLRYTPYLDLRNHYFEHAFFCVFSYKKNFMLMRLKK